MTHIQVPAEVLQRCLEVRMRDHADMYRDKYAKALQEEGRVKLRQKWWQFWRHTTIESWYFSHWDHGSFSRARRWTPKAQRLNWDEKYGNLIRLVQYAKKHGDKVALGENYAYLLEYEHRDCPVA